MILRSATLVDGSVVDVTVDDGVVTAVTPSEPGGELDGMLLLPALAEPHAHLDKALTGSHGVGGADLMTAVRTWSAVSAGITVDDARDRALRMLRQLAANGTTAVRTHVNATSGSDPLLPLRVLLDLRDEVPLDLQVVFLAMPGQEPLVRQAIELGIDLVGGAPHSGTEPAAWLSTLLDLAEEAGLGVDVHTDEQLNPSLHGLRDLCSRPFAGPRTASHCVGISTMEPVAQRTLAELVAASGVGVVACPLTNLGLQARGITTSPPRGLTAVRALLDAGALVAAGTDNVRDVFNPVGRGDPLEVAALLVNAAHLTVAEAFDLVSTRARQALGLAPAGPTVGARADLLAIRAADLEEAVAAAPADRIVWRAGVEIARTTVQRSPSF